MALPILRIMKRHVASCAHAKELSKLRLQSFAKRRQRDDPAAVENREPVDILGFLTISRSDSIPSFLSADASFSY